MENQLENNTVTTATVDKSIELIDPVLDALAKENQKDKDWFIITDDNSGGRIVYVRDNFKEEIKKGLLNGNLKSDNKIQGHFKNQEGKWVLENTNIKKFSKDIKELRMMYDPIWNHAMVGLKWGALIGIGLKLLDTTILLGSADPLLAVLFLAAIGICFIPKIGIVGMIIAGFLLARFSGMNFFMMAISAALVGVLLGCLPGMFLGGLIGWARRTSLPKAHDATDEPPSILLKTVVLPLVGATAIIFSFIVYVNPWLMKLLE